jgi:two-component system, sensor histidine kinase RegB
MTPAGSVPPSSDLIPGAAASINLSWLIQLRWAGVVGQLTTVLIVRWVLGVALPMALLLAVLTLEVLINLALEAWQRRSGGQQWTKQMARRAERVQGLVMGVDTLLLGVLLYLTGGITNPFAAFFFVHVVLAAVLLQARYAYVGTAVAFSCLVVLFFWYRPLPELEGPLHLIGLVVALGMTGAITVFFVTRVANALQRRSEELVLQRERQARAERLEALGTLAAGAAHELASPLSTIAVVAKELERRLASDGADAAVVGDARLMREEVARCRRILDRMTLRSGESVGESLSALTVEELLGETLAELQGRERVRVAVHSSARGLNLEAPRAALAMALRAVLSNALDASAADQGVELGARVYGAELEVSVLDRGEGMDPERLRRALDPFFTTKEPGRGMGLGLYLSASTAERLGGSLTLRSSPGAGTRALLRLPLERLRRRPGAASESAATSERDPASDCTPGALHGLES